MPDYNELSNGHSKATPPATVEAFNYQVKTSEKLPTEEQEEEEEEHQQQQEDEHEEEEEEANTDNLPSLKLDSLSLYSSDSVSPTCTLSLVADDNQSEAPTKAPVLCHQVTLEDVSDDSDEECSPKKPKELFIPEGADDFFAIEIVGTPTQLQQQQQQTTPSSIPSPVAEPEFAAFQETTPVTSSQKQSAELEQRLEVENDDDDFGDFADFSEAPAIVEPKPVPAPAAAPAPYITRPADDDDGFDDFQDFVTPTEAAPVVVKEEDGEDDDDDFGDFGDFSEPIYAPAAAPIPAAVVTPVLPQPPPPAAPQLSITERVKPVLELMFPSQEAHSAPANPAKHLPLAEQQTLHFGAIEQAHALDYQWACSEMRHSLVRSLAIDSRNIVSDARDVF